MNTFQNIDKISKTKDTDKTFFDKALDKVSDYFSPSDKVELSKGSAVKKAVKSDDEEYKPSFVGKIFDDILYVGRAFIKKDKGFAFRQAVEAVKDVILQDVPEAAKPLIMPKISTVTRGIQTVLDIKQAISTFKDPQSTTLDKIVDVAHVVTDIVGIAGMFTPAFPILTAISYLGDLGAVGYHLMSVFEQDPYKKNGKKEKEDAKPVKNIGSKIEKRPVEKDEKKIKTG